MPQVTDKDRIRSLLRVDPVWSVYALCDLSPGLFPKTTWFVPDLTLVLHDYGTSILFAMGPGSVREALDCVTWPVHLQVRGDALAEIARHAAIASSTTMWRMGWSVRDRLAAPSEVVTALTAQDVAALRRLYSDGDASGESPDFFVPAAVEAGAFFGIYEGEGLVAAAGTHVLSREEGAATIGNVYIRRDRRGRGLGRLVVSAVLREVAALPVVGLNVRIDNDAALALYESLGFERHCQFSEARATGWLDASR